MYSMQIVSVKTYYYFIVLFWLVTYQVIWLHTRNGRVKRRFQREMTDLDKRKIYLITVILVSLDLNLRTKKLGVTELIYI